MGTKLITNPATNTAKGQGTLPYGTALDAETTASTNQKFTSYDRSDATGLDYAVNRIYSSEQARFLQPDPIGMASVDLTDPQSLNLYTYARNNPIDLVDPSGTHAHNIRYFLDGFEVSPETFFSMVLSGSAVPPGGYSGALGNWERFGETGRRFVPNSLYIHGLLNGLEPTSPFYEGGGSFAQNDKAPISKKKQKKADKQVKKLKKKLNKPGKNCQKNVINKLKTIAGFSVGAFKEFLNKGVNIYDGTKSTIALTSATHSSQIKGKVPKGYTVAKLFAENTGLNALTSGNLSVNGLTVFWNPKADFSPSRIFHEALHGFGASLNDGSLGDFGDKELLKLFNVKGVAGKNTGGITEYINKHCF